MGRGGGAAALSLNGQQGPRVPGVARLSAYQAGCVPSLLSTFLAHKDSPHLSLNNTPPPLSRSSHLLVSAALLLLLLVLPLPLPPPPLTHTHSLSRSLALLDSKGLLLGNRDEALSGLGNVQAGKVAEFLLEMKVRVIRYCHNYRHNHCHNPSKMLCVKQVFGFRSKCMYTGLTVVLRYIWAVEVLVY